MSYPEDEIKQWRPVQGGGRAEKSYIHARDLARAILLEAYVSFLGYGIQPPLPSWGNLASEGLEELHLLAHHNNTIAWWLIVWPCGLLGLTLMALNFLGDALREKLDPTTRG